MKKKKEDLNGLKGNYLYLKFNCYDSEVEIENTKSSGKPLIIIIVLVVFFGIIFIIIFVIVIILCCRRKRRALNTLPNIPQNYGYQVTPYYAQMPIYPQYGNNGIVYQVPNVVYVSQNNQNNYNIPQNVPVVENQINQTIPQSSTKRDIYEKPKI